VNIVSLCINIVKYFILVFIKLIIQMLLKYFHQFLDGRIYDIIASS